MVRRITSHDVAAPSTTEPSIGAWRFPITSSSPNSTAAIGVLKAAAIAAVAPTGTSSFTRSVLKPRRRPKNRGDARADVDRWPFAAERKFRSPAFPR